MDNPIDDPIFCWCDDPDVPLDGKVYLICKTCDRPVNPVVAVMPVCSNLKPVNAVFDLLSRLRKEKL